MMRLILRRINGATLAAILFCAGSVGLPAQTNQPTIATNPTPGEVAYYGYRVVNTFPHDRNAFTQGLFYQDGKFLESTGLWGASSLRAVELTTGKVLQQVNVPKEYFAEGLAQFGDKLYQLTWTSQKGFIYDAKTFAKLGEFSYPGEGWGLTTDGRWLIMSDGTSRIRFMDPPNFKEDHSIRVLLRGHEETNLNELEYIHGEIFANIWQEDRVARIDPTNGRVTGIIDFSYLLPLKYREQQKVLNGIAYDAEGDRLFVTGKDWPELYEVKLTNKPSP